MRDHLLHLIAQKLLIGMLWKLHSKSLQNNLHSLPSISVIKISLDPMEVPEMYNHLIIEKSKKEVESVKNSLSTSLASSCFMFLSIISFLNFYENIYTCIHICIIHTHIYIHISITNLSHTQNKLILIIYLYH